MQNTSCKVWVTGMGTVNSTGRSVATLWKSVLEKESFIKEGFGLIPDELLFSLEQDLLHFLPASQGIRIRELFQKPTTSKLTLLTLHSACQAMQSAGWEKLQEGDAVFFATTTGQIPVWENDLMDYLEGRITSPKLAETFQYEPLGISIRDTLKILGGHGCRTQVISSACSASTQALVLASLWLKEGKAPPSGKARRALVGGTELLCRLTGSGFKGLQLLSSEPATPFGPNRKGINLSEASAFLCLETEPQNPPLALLSGGGLANDAYHMTSPDPTGEGICRAMKAALHSAGLRPSAITWVHAHGTGSQANDDAEAKAIQTLFAGCRPIVSSTKPIHGHALAASGVLESIICMMGIREGIVPATRGLTSLHGTEDLTFGTLSLPGEHQSLPVRHVLKNSLGFGGANAAVVFSSCELESS